MMNPRSCVISCIMVFIVTAGANEISEWNPNDCIKYLCNCQLTNGKKSVTCTRKNIKLTPLNGFFLPKGSQMVDLSNNKISVLNNNAFHQRDPQAAMEGLLAVNLSRNYIQRILTDAFKYIDNLVTLDLSHNKIGQLYPETFQNMQKLNTLYLQHNQIKALLKFTFNGLNSLKILDLSYGQLTHISWWAFFFSYEPTLLNLKNNSLTTFHSNYIFSPEGTMWKYGGRIDLTNNPVKCDCDLERIFNDNRPLLGVYDLTCSEPPILLGTQFSALAPSDFIGCGWYYILPRDNKTVVGVVNTTTTLSCETIEGLLFKNWTITSRSDNLTDWPDRYNVSQSETWVNLTIDNTQKSDEGEYRCNVAEKVQGSTRTMYQNWTLVVREGTKVRLTPKETSHILWLVLSLMGILILLSVVIIVVFMRRRRSAMMTTEVYAPGTEQGSHLYEDVDTVLMRLAQRSLPKLPKHDYATVLPPPQQTQYIQHCMAVRSPLSLPHPSLHHQEEAYQPASHATRESYSNELYFLPRTSQIERQLEDMVNSNPVLQALCELTLPYSDSTQPQCKKTTLD